MKLLLFLVFSVFATTALANKPALVVDYNTAAVVTLDQYNFDGKVNRTEWYRYRAIYNSNPAARGGTTLMIEKIRLPNVPGGQASVVWQKNFTPWQMSGLKTRAEKLKKDEKDYCCPLRELRWDQFELKFVVKVGNKNMMCSTTDAKNDSSLSISCI